MSISTLHKTTTYFFQEFLRSMAIIMNDNECKLFTSILQRGLLELCNCILQPKVVRIFLDRIHQYGSSSGRLLKNVYVEYKQILTFLFPRFFPPPIHASSLFIFPFKLSLHCMQKSLTSSNPRCSSKASPSLHYTRQKLPASLRCSNNIDKKRRKRSDFQNTLRVVRVSPASTAVNNPDVPEGALSRSPAL